MLAKVQNLNNKRLVVFKGAPEHSFSASPNTHFGRTSGSPHTKRITQLRIGFLSFRIVAVLVVTQPNCLIHKRQTRWTGWSACQHNCGNDLQNFGG